MDTGLVWTPLMKAVRFHRQPAELILQSDLGSQYAAQLTCKNLEYSLGCSIIKKRIVATTPRWKASGLVKKMSWST